MKSSNNPIATAIIAEAERAGVADIVAESLEAKRKGLTILDGTKLEMNLEVFGLQFRNKVLRSMTRELLNDDIVSLEGHLNSKPSSPGLDWVRRQLEEHGDISILWNKWPKQGWTEWPESVRQEAATRGPVDSISELLASLSFYLFLFEKLRLRIAVCQGRRGGRRCKRFFVDLKNRRRIYCIPSCGTAVRVLSHRQRNPQS